MPSESNGILRVTVASRVFLLDQDDGLYRLPAGKFQAMLAEPAAHPLPQFSGQRVRAANVLVELVDQVPTSIQQITYYVMTFDRDGWLDVPRFHRQVFGDFEQRMARRLTRNKRHRESQNTVIDAANRFEARGATWVPSAPLADVIQDAALGRVKTRRL